MQMPSQAYYRRQEMDKKTRWEKRTEEMDTLRSALKYSAEHPDVLQSQPLRMSREQLSAARLLPKVIDNALGAIEGRKPLLPGPKILDGYFLRAMQTGRKTVDIYGQKFIIPSATKKRKK